MAHAQGGVQEKTRTELVGEKTKTSDTGNKAAIPLDYSVGGHGVDVNMEAPISNEDLIRAGGLGARDEVGSLMPAAVDATDYEESLMYAMDYEDKGDVADTHPGLGASQQQIDIPGGALEPSQGPQLK